MPRPRPLNSALLKFIAVGFCALLLLLAVEQSADASCGDWLAGHSPVEATVSTGSGPTNAPQHAAPDMPSPQRPCHGPSCGNAPVPSAPPVPVQVEQTSQDWLKLTIHDDLLSADACSQTLPQDEPLPETASRQRLERPPCC